MVGRVGDGAGEIAARPQLPVSRRQPLSKALQRGPRPLLAEGVALFRRRIRDRALEQEDLADADQCFARADRVGGPCLEEIAAGVAPAAGAGHAQGVGNQVELAAAVEQQAALEAREVLGRAAALLRRGHAEDHVLAVAIHPQARRAELAVRAVLDGQACVVGLRPRSAPNLVHHRRHDAFQQPRAPQRPAAQRRDAHVQTLAGEAPRLAMQGKVVGELVTEHLGQQPVATHRARQREGGAERRLHPFARTGGTGDLVGGDLEDLEVPGHPFQPLGHVLADHVERALAARTARAVRVGTVDAPPRQGVGQPAAPMGVARDVLAPLATRLLRRRGLRAVGRGRVGRVRLGRIRRFRVGRGRHGLARRGEQHELVWVQHEPLVATARQPGLEPGELGRELLVARHHHGQRLLARSQGRLALLEQGLEQRDAGGQRLDVRGGGGRAHGAGDVTRPCPPSTPLSGGFHRGSRAAVERSIPSKSADRSAAVMCAVFPATRGSRNLPCSSLL